MHETLTQKKNKLKTKDAMNLSCPAAAAYVTSATSLKFASVCTKGILCATHAVFELIEICLPLSPEY